MCRAIRKVWKLLEQIEKRPVAVLIGLLEDVVEIADRLMIVQCEDELIGCGMGSDCQD